MKLLTPEVFNTLPNAFLLDLDNTLYPYEQAHSAAYSAVKEKVIKLFTIGDIDFDQAYSQARIEVKRQLNDTASSHSRLLYYQKMLELIGLHSQPLFALDLEQTYWRSYLKNVVLFDGVLELLDDIRLLGIPMAIVTDLTTQIQLRKIIYLELDRYIDFIVTSEEVGSDKPNGNLFAVAIDKMQVPSDCIWMIGDNAYADIFGARQQIGAITLQKIHKGVTQGTGKEQPDAVFTEFKQIQKLIKKIEKNAG